MPDPRYGLSRHIRNGGRESYGTRAVYPTFVNLGDKPLVSGDGLLLQVRFRLLKDGAAAPEVRDAVTVSPALEYRYMTIE